MKKADFDALFSTDGNPVDSGAIEDHIGILATSATIPDLSLGICAARFEESAPILRALLIRAADGETLTDDETTLLFRGLHVLGGCRDTESCKPLLRLLRRPTEVLDYLLGDAMTESMAKIAAGVFDGDAAAYFAFAADPWIDEFARHAVLGAAGFLTWDGRIDLAVMRSFLERFGRDRPVPAGDHSWVAWFDTVSRLGLRDLAPLVEEIWNEGWLPERVTEWRYFESDLAEAARAPEDIKRFTDHNLGYIDDIATALDWARGGELAEDIGPPAPVINPWRHVGRNDPCPCGSGKKMKKCCNFR